MRTKIEFRSPRCIGFAIEACHFFQHVKRALLHFLVNTSNILADNSGGNELHATEEEYGGQSEWPIEQSAMEDEPHVKTECAHCNGAHAYDDTQREYSRKGRRGEGKHPIQRKPYEPAPG